MLIGRGFELDIGSREPAWSNQGQLSPALTIILGGEQFCSPSRVYAHSVSYYDDSAHFVQIHLLGDLAKIQLNWILIKQFNFSVKNFTEINELLGEALIDVQLS